MVLPKFHSKTGWKRWLDLVLRGNLPLPRPNNRIDTQHTKSNSTANADWYANCNVTVRPEPTSITRASTPVNLITRWLAMI